MTTAELAPDALYDAAVINVPGAVVCRSLDPARLFIRLRLDANPQSAVALLDTVSMAIDDLQALGAFDIAMVANALPGDDSDSNQPELVELAVIGHFVPTATEITRLAKAKVTA